MSEYLQEIIAVNQQNPGLQEIEETPVLEAPGDIHELDDIPENDLEEEPMQTCDQCGHEYPEDTLADVGDMTMCADCAEDWSFVCERCGDREHNNDAVWVGEDVLCSCCAGNHTFICAVCGEREYDDDISYVDDEPVCEHCCDNSYRISTCAGCGELHFAESMDYDDEDEEYYCGACSPDRELHAYHCGMHLHFYGEGKYHMGVELEVDRDHDVYDRNNSARKVLNLMDGHVYCEKDSSLDYGFEIITHPHTYEELMALPWGRVLNELRQDGWRGHDVQTAGLHVHIGRDCFDDEDAIMRFCTFFENNWEFVKAFSRRTDRQLADYASRYFADDCDHVKYSASEVKAKTEESRSRYRAINLTNYSTVEVRVFRSTLKHSTFMASLELVHLLAERSNQITDHEAETMTVAGWLEGASETLQVYCTSRGYALAMDIGTVITTNASINTDTDTEREAA